MAEHLGKRIAPPGNQHIRLAASADNRAFEGIVNRVEMRLGQRTRAALPVPAGIIRMNFNVTAKFTAKVFIQTAPSADDGARPANARRINELGQRHDPSFRSA